MLWHTGRGLAEGRYGTGACVVGGLVVGGVRVSLTAGSLWRCTGAAEMEGRAGGCGWRASVRLEGLGLRRRPAGVGV